MARKRKRKIPPKGRTPRRLRILSGVWPIGSRILKAGDEILTPANIPSGVEVEVLSEEPCHCSGQKSIEQQDPSNPEKLVYRHKGGGRYEVVDAATDKKVHDGWLSKEEAKEKAEG